MSAVAREVSTYLPILWRYDCLAFNQTTNDPHMNHTYARLSSPTPPKTARVCSTNGSTGLLLPLERTLTRVSFAAASNTVHAHLQIYRRIIDLYLERIPVDAVDA